MTQTALTSFTARAETVVVALNAGGTPTRFRWRGRMFRIDRIDRVWRAAHDSPSGMRMYRVHSGERGFLLCQDRVRQRWLLVRSPLRVRLGLALSGVAGRLGV